MRAGENRDPTHLDDSGATGLHPDRRHATGRADLVHWTGDQFVLGSPSKAPKLKALAADPRVALTIDDHTVWPHKVLLVRGSASVEMLDDVVPEYALSATRYFGPEQGPAWVGTLRGKPMARIAITPNWVGVLDFETRFPRALAS